MRQGPQRALPRDPQAALPRDLQPPRRREPQPALQRDPQPPRRHGPQPDLRHEPRLSRRRGPQLALVAVVQVLAMGLWFSASSVVPALRDEWGLGREAGILLAVTVQLGFATGAVLSAAVNLADRARPQVLVAAGSALGAATTFAFPAAGPAAAVPLRFVTGFALAAVYPVGMKIVVSWFPRQRGAALGVLVGALTLGSAMPSLLGGIGDWRAVLDVAAALALLAAPVALILVKPGPDWHPSPPWAPRYVLDMIRSRPQRLVCLGYFGHMWELYALWAWLPTYVAAAGSGDSFTIIGVAGAAGALLGGLLADRFGRPAVTIGAMLTSAACGLLSAAAWGTPLLAPLLLVWGAAVIADSAQFSAALSEVADPRYVGTALTAMTAAGFVVSAVTIQLLPLLADLTGWRDAVTLLSIGPLLGAAAMTGVRAAAGARTPRSTGRP
ncbi:MFS transporter [Amycolatopsis deserti]|uniref:MFS transporter n=1 Tax=Amycolatopsis deserti TaxID=185696 RepID=A0ABQ3JFV3_9PSEU|nr:MFS transporter [Amycolatopsis deserti]GHF15563.1 MFS transporter [Amycolatopsis deserti]